MIFFSRKLSVPSLIDLCRSLRYGLNSGLMLRDVMDLLANKGTRSVRVVAAKVSQDLKAGWSLHDALQKQEKAFPPLFIALCAVGEESGNLPEVLHDMEKYYVMREKLRREFKSQIAWPVFQFVAAVCVISVLILILGIIPAPGADESNRIDPLGLGLLGTSGALKFFFGVWIVVFGVAAVFLGLQEMLQRRAVVERFMLAMPLIGPCLRSMALARFCLASRLMMDTSLSVFKTIRLAFIATDNMAFITAFPAVEASLKQGNSIATSFAKARVFPEKFLSAVAVAEESGRLPESLNYLREEYEDETRRRLTALTRVASFLVMVLVFAVIITCIFRIFLNVYLGQIEKASEAAGKITGGGK
jgi:type IV pilus assembly protein PilC